MSQNVISITFSADDLSQINAALTQLEQKFDALLITLTADERQGLYKMGDQSEAFVRQTVPLLVQHSKLIPPSLDVAEAQRDLLALDLVRPMIQRLSRLLTQAEHSEIALGSDLNSAATVGYNFLKLAGKGEGLDEALSQISVRFQRKRATKKTSPESSET